DPTDAEAIAAIFGGQDYYAYQYSFTSGGPSHKALPPVLALKLLPLVAATGRLALRTSVAYSDFQPAAWDAGEPWKLWLEVRQDDRDQWNITGSLRRGEERMDLSEPLLLLESGFVILKGRIARFDPGGAFPWVAQLRDVKRIPFPDRVRDTVLAKLLETTVVPPMEMDEAMQFEHRRQPPRLGLRLTQRRQRWGEDDFQGTLLLDYGRGWMEDASETRGIWIPEERVFIARDQEAEKAARETLQNLGLKPASGGERYWRVTPKTMPRAARELLRAGWHVEAEGKAFRRPGKTQVSVQSGIDWFELHAEVDYGGATATLPELLAALRRGDN